MSALMPPSMLGGGSIAAWGTEGVREIHYKTPSSPDNRCLIPSVRMSGPACVFRRFVR